MEMSGNLRKGVVRIPKLRCGKRDFLETASDELTPQPIQTPTWLALVSTIP